MAQILLNSPYLVKHVESGLESISVVLWVVQGAKSTAASGVIAYELETKAYNAYATVDIAQLARDFLSPLYDAPIWVSYRITKVVNGVETVITPAVTLAGLFGHGYFLEGANPQAKRPVTGETILQSNTEIYIPKGEGVTIPVLTDDVAQALDFYYKGNYKGSTSVTLAQPATNSNEIISYFHLSHTAHTWKPQERNVYPSTLTRNIDPVGNNVPFPYDEIWVGVADTVVRVTEIECIKGTPIKLHFLNKWGAIQAVWFFGRETTTTEATREKFNRNIKDINLYSINSHQSKILHVNGKTRKVLNTGFYPESFNETFKQLMFSPSVWLYDGDNDKHIPINIVTSQMRHKTSKDDKLINYEVEFEYAFDEINNIK